MQPIVLIIIGVVAVGIVGYSFLNDPNNFRFISGSGQESNPAFEPTSKEFIIDPNKVRKKSVDPDGKPGTGDETFHYAYEGCTYETAAEALEKCEIGFAVIHEVTEDDCIAEVARDVKISIGPCEYNPEDVVPIAVDSNLLK